MSADESGSTRFYYDGFGRVLKKVQITSGAITQTVQYAYGESGSTTGRLTSLTYPSGDVASYTYDAAGRISSITIKHTVSGAVVTEPLISNIVYNPFGRRDGLDLVVTARRINEASIWMAGCRPCRWAAHQQPTP